jgi:hypothetical protein
MSRPLLKSRPEQIAADVGWTHGSHGVDAPAQLTLERTPLTSGVQHYLSSVSQSRSIMSQHSNTAAHPTYDVRPNRYSP